MPWVSRRRIAILIGTVCLSLACGSSPPPSAHPRQDDPSAVRAAGEGVAPPEAQIAFLEVLEGSLSEDAARASLVPMRPRVQSCLAASSLHVEGHIVVRLEVAASGEIERSGTDHVDGLDPELVFCIVRAIRGCRMPASEAAAQLRIGLDFNDPRGLQNRTAQPDVELADEPTTVEASTPDDADADP